MTRGRPRRSSSWVVGDVVVGTTGLIVVVVVLGGGGPFDATVFSPVRCGRSWEAVVVLLPLMMLIRGGSGEEGRPVTSPLHKEGEVVEEETMTGWIGSSCGRPLSDRSIVCCESLSPGLSGFWLGGDDDGDDDDGDHRGGGAGGRGGLFISVLGGGGSLALSLRWWWCSSSSSSFPPSDDIEELETLN